MTVLILAPERDFTADRMVKVLEDRRACRPSRHGMVPAAGEY